MSKWCDYLVKYILVDKMEMKNFEKCSVGSKLDEVCHKFSYVRTVDYNN